MLKNRQEILAVGELAVFLLAWVLSALAVIDDREVQSDLQARNDAVQPANIN